MDNTLTQPADELVQADMGDTLIIYEQPLNELMRACLRLEYLFKQIDHCLEHPSLEDSIEIVVANIIDILHLLDRPDLKSRMTKEFHRYARLFSSWLETPDISEHALKTTLRQLANFNEYFLNSHGKLGQSLRELPFIASIRQHFNYPGDCCIDSPIYYYWLHQPSEAREQDIYDWLDHLNQSRAAIELLLRIARDSIRFREVRAEKGFYHENLNPQVPCQLIRIGLTQGQSYYPEISAGKHRATVRLIIAQTDSPPHQTADDVTFQLSCCAI